MKRPAMILLLVATFGSLCAEEERPRWQEPGCRHRLSILLPTCAKQSLGVGFVITGEDFYRWTGRVAPAADGLRFFLGDRPVAYQVEQARGTGDSANEDDNRFDHLALSLELSRRPQTLHLYYDGEPTSPPAVPASAAELVEQPDAFYPLLFRNGELEVGLGGPGKEPTTQNATHNHSRATLASVVWRGITFANSRGYGPDGFPRCLGTGPGPHHWSSPVVRHRGPVRTVVEMRCEDYREEKDENETFRGTITHRIAFWHGLPIVDFEESVEYSATSLDGSWSYSCRWPEGVTRKRPLRDDDALLVTLADEVQTFPLGDKVNHDWANVYVTDNPEEGWFAWMFPTERAGLAMFYEQPDTMKQRAAWVTYRPALHPDIRIRKTPYDSIEINLSFKDRARRCRDHYRRGLRYIFLHNEAPEDVRLLYRLWGQPLADVATITWPEQRP